MQALLSVLDTMEEKFAGAWRPDEMPLWMQALHSEAARRETPLNVRLFFVKLVVNRPRLFEPYAADWLEPLCLYLAERNSGGKGFHYFSRDLLTLLLNWQDFVP